MPHNSQSAAFITSLHDTGWHSLTQFVDGGHTFELLSKGPKTILVQIYPDGHGFNVWRPVTDSNSIADTVTAVEEYVASKAR